MPAEDITPTEEWRAIPGYPKYEASTEGRIRRIAYVLSTKSRRGDGGGYPYVNLFQNGKRRHRFVHDLVARTFIGECPPGYEHNHKNGNKDDARPENLEFMTRSQNQRHSLDVLNSHVNKGTQCGMHKLNDAQVIAIHTMRANGTAIDTVAAAFGVCKMTVSLIARGKIWRHLSLPILPRSYSYNQRPSK